MTSDDWFRRRTWTTRDRDEFREKLNRARGARSRSQYLRLQAHHLQEVGTPAMLEGALELLDELVARYPDPLQLAAAHQQRAECLASLARPDQALAAYRDAFAAQRAFPNVRGHAYLGFAELALAHGRRELYAEGLSMLDEFGDDEPFPVMRYRSHASRAFMLEALGDTDAAAGHAALALQAASTTESPFRNHRGLGIVTATDDAVQERLWTIARGGAAAAT